MEIDTAVTTSFQPHPAVGLEPEPEIQPVAPAPVPAEEPENVAEPEPEPKAEAELESESESDPETSRKQVEPDETYAPVFIRCAAIVMAGILVAPVVLRLLDTFIWS